MEQLRKRLLLLSICLAFTAVSAGNPDSYDVSERVNDFLYSLLPDFETMFMDPEDVDLDEDDNYIAGTTQEQNNSTHTGNGVAQQQQNTGASLNNAIRQAAYNRNQRRNNNEHVVEGEGARNVAVGEEHIVDTRDTNNPRRNGTVNTAINPCFDADELQQAAQRHRARVDNGEAPIEPTNNTGVRNNQPYQNNNGWFVPAAKTALSYCDIPVFSALGLSGAGYLGYFGYKWYSGKIFGTLTKRQKQKLVAAACGTFLSTAYLTARSLGYISIG